MSKPMSIPLDYTTSSASQFCNHQQKAPQTLRSGNATKHSPSPSLVSQKQPRTTHRHHRKPESNLNHLLNFSYARTSNQAGQSHSRRATRTNPTFGRGSGHHPLDKAHFVNANYRFVVHPSGDYKANLSEPDIPVDWDNILQVLASIKTQCSSCPICLDSVPIAPRMAKCGHVFCHPCVLRYLDSQDVSTGRSGGKWRKCPICFDAIYEKELRSVRWVDKEDELPQKGKDITLQLLRRETGSIFATPRDAVSLSPDAVPWHNQANVLEYARILKGDATYMSEEASREVRDLQAMQVEDFASFGDDGRWTLAAIERILDMNEIHEILGVAPAVSTTKSQIHKPTRAPVIYNSNLSDPKPEADSSSSNAHTGVSEDAYYFYQPRSSRYHFLSSLDIRVLKKAFSSFANLPTALIGKVEHATPITVDEDLRRRTKYLAHVPLGCEITFLECDWSGVLEPEVVQSFKVETDRRRKKHHDKAVSEEAARRRAQALDERRERVGLGELLWHDEDTSYFSRNDETNTYEVFADEPALATSPSSASMPSSSVERVSVWGQRLPPAQAVAPAPEPDDEWQKQLESFYEANTIAASVADVTPGKKAKKKKTLVLMSTGGGRRA